MMTHWPTVMVAKLDIFEGDEGNKVISTCYILGMKCKGRVRRKTPNFLALSIGSMIVPIPEIKNTKELLLMRLNFST